MSTLSRFPWAMGTFNYVKGHRCPEEDKRMMALGHYTAVWPYLIDTPETHQHAIDKKLMTSCPSCKESLFRPADECWLVVPKVMTNA